MPPSEALARSVLSTTARCMAMVASMRLAMTKRIMISMMVRLVLRVMESQDRLNMLLNMRFLVLLIVNSI